MGNSNLHVVQVRPEGPEAHSPGRAAYRSSVLTP